MATEAATLQNVTRSFLWHSIMLFIGAAGLYCVAPSIYTGLSGTVLIGLHLFSGFCVGLISRPVRPGISKGFWTYARRHCTSCDVHDIS